MYAYVYVFVYKCFLKKTNTKPAGPIHQYPSHTHTLTYTI